MRGFSLLEVLVAFVILSLVAIALFRLFSGALNNASAADDYSRAVLVAESALATAAAAQPLREATQSGYGRRRPHRVDDAGRAVLAARSRLARTRSAWPRRMPTRLYRVSAEVTFRGDLPAAKRTLCARRRCAWARGMRNDGAATVPRRARLHAGRAHDRARADGGHGVHTLRLAFPRGAELGRRRGEGRCRCPTCGAAQTYLRAQIAAQYPQRLWKAAELPLLFAGERDEMRYAAALPERVAEGGVYYFRLAVVRSGEKSQLVQERAIPDLAALQEPEFRDAERSVLADDIAELAIGYFGRDANAADADAPTWRDRWDDRQRLPLLVRIDVKPAREPPGRRSSSSRGARRRRAARPGTRERAVARGRAFEPFHASHPSRAFGPHPPSAASP